MHPSMSSSTSTCCSVSGWIAPGNYVCENYNQNSWWCEIFGDSDVSEDGVSANEACCGKCFILLWVLLEI